MERYGYSACIRCGWEDGIHDCRGLTYEHPWVVIYRLSGAAVGCWSREEARRVWQKLKDGYPAEAVA